MRIASEQKRSSTFIRSTASKSSKPCHRRLNNQTNFHPIAEYRSDPAAEFRCAKLCSGNNPSVFQMNSLCFHSPDVTSEPDVSFWGKAENSLEANRVAMDRRGKGCYRTVIPGLLPARQFGVRSRLCTSDGSKWQGTHLAGASAQPFCLISVGG